jgi:hypothetical protein
MPVPPRLAPGDAITAEWLNSVRDAALADLAVDPASGLEVYRNGPVTTLRRSKRLGAKWAKTGGGGIPGRTGAATPGKALCTIYDFNGTTLAAGAQDMVYNHAAAAADGNDWIQVKAIDGYWFLDWEECT